MIRLYAAGAAVAGVLAFLAWFAWDQRQDALRDADLKGRKAQDEHTSTAANDAKEIDDLRDDDLRDELTRRLSGGSDTD